MSSSSKWVQLPEEVLTIIFLRLDLFPDRVRFGLVCKSWRCLQRHFARPPPLLLTSLSSNTSPPNYRLFDLFTQKLSVKLHLRLHEWPLQFSGPTNGFLLIRATPSQDYFINPITNEKVYIPDLHHPWWEMRHVTISHAPNLTNCTVVVDGTAGLAMWRPGGARWTWICTWTSPLEFFGCMIFYDEKLYVMRANRYTLVYVFDPSPRMTEMISPGVNYLQGKKVLVPLQFVGSNRELFIVLEVRNFYGGADSFGFQVFQLENGTKWKRISSLGDRFFLLSDFRSEAFSDKDFAGLGFERNCIYLFKDGNSGVAVYSLEEERFLNSIPLLDERRAIDWLMPAGVSWTEEEDRMFLLGLQKLGKGNWRGIARNFVISRTPTQVASHAQKYFIRQTNFGRRKRRSCLFDIVPDEASELPMNSQESELHGNNLLPAPPTMDEECESMDSNNSVDGEAVVPKQETSQRTYPVMYPAFFTPVLPYPLPLWPDYDVESREKCTHEIVKPTPVHSKAPLNVDELVGISRLSIGESIVDAPSHHH